MKKIYKRSDRVSVAIDDITVKLAPLTFDQKNEIQQCMLDGRAKNDIAILSKGITLAMRYSLKGIEGVQDTDGQPYKLTADTAGNLTDECIDDLLNLENKEKLTLVCMALLRGIPDQFSDEKGLPIVGVSFATTSSEGSKVPNA